MTSSTQALVIGNGAYPDRLALASPPRDATAMRDALIELGVDVTFVLDEDYLKTSAAIDGFIEDVNKDSVTTSILYYSGHGLQLKNTNYIVPIDFKDPSGNGVTRLIGVQPIIDRMTRTTAVRIVLLDACRTGEDADTILGGKGVEIDKAFTFDGKPVAFKGLAEIKAANDTFIAFAAGPGEVARDGLGDGALSPFTGALVKHLSSVDLPLSNLTSRVRQDVLEATGRTQRTWDQSSLRSPYYFNPGSLLLFAGNLMALVGLAISIVIYSLVLASPDLTFGWVAQAAFLPIASFTVLLVGTQTVYTRLRGTAYGVRAPSFRRDLVESLRKGATGGFLGSLACSLFLSGPYYWIWSLDGTPAETFGQLYLEVTYGTALAACILGAFTLAGALIAMASAPSGASEPTRAGRAMLGAIAGGALTGLIAAPPITAYFGLMSDRPEMKPWLLLPGSAAGASVLVFSIVNFDLERLSRRRVRTSALASLLALAAGIPAAVVVFGPLYLLGIVDAVTVFLEAHDKDAIALMAGGACYGLPVGIVLGVVIGTAIIITQKWSGKPVLT